MTIKGASKVFARSNKKALLGVVMFAAIGTGLILRSHAATSVAQIEVENTTITGSATTISDSSASGSNAVRFGDTSSNGWQAAVDAATSQQSWTPIENWYTAHTGYEALGYTKEDLTPGPIVSQYDGQVIEGVAGSVIRVSHNNVTIRGCLITDGGTYGAYLNPTYDAPVTGLKIEYCTFYYSQVAPEDDHKNAMYIHPALTPGPGYDVTIQYCNVYNWSAGIRTMNKVLTQYNYIHDFQHPPGVHANSIRPAGVGGTAYRNYGTDGSSGVFSIYFDKETTTDITLRENIANGLSPLASPSYLINLKAGSYESTATNIKIIDNMFGPGYQYGYQAGGGGIPWGINGNQRTGNHELMSGTPQGNQ